jgi:DNA polymerase-3 subunit gamma/tau
VYEALARKWRPRTFDEVVGQGHVTRALSNALSLGRIHHAYLFTGTRGVGKTTFARILARAINCVDGPTAKPCLSCPACDEVGRGTSPDVQEIDGASNTGVDDVRRLREGAAYPPVALRYKVYIVDEVHMLSKNAFNALLKLLEEPPPHVIFIFATTEPHKIPETILSRVQRFDFRMLTEGEITDRFRGMAEAEEIECDADALALLARYAFGSMRDGLTLFEQAAVSGNGRVTVPLVEEMIGLVGAEAPLLLVSLAASGDVEGALSAFRELLARGADLKYLFLSLIDVLRDAAVLAFTGKDALLLRHSPSSLASMRDLVSLRGKEEWMLLLDVAFRSEKDVLATEFPRFGFELLLLRLANAASLSPVDRLDAGAPAAPPRAAAEPSRSTASHRAPPPAAAPPAPPADPAAPAAPAPERGAPAAPPPSDLWRAAVRNLEGKRKVILVGILNSLTGWTDGDDLVVDGPPALLDLLKSLHLPLFTEAVAEAAGRAVKVRFAAGAEKKSPDEVTAAEEKPKGDPLERKAMEDPLVQEVLREFDGIFVKFLPPAPPPSVTAAEPPGEAGLETEFEETVAEEGFPPEEAPEEDET